MRFPKKSFAVSFVLLVSLAAGAVGIVIPREPEPSTVTAAEELKTHLEKSLGGKIAVVREGAAVPGPRIYLGDTRFAREAGIDFSKYGMEESLIRAVGGDVVIGGGRPRGTLYGVYSFLERFCGVVWPDPLTAAVPKKRDLAIPKGTDLRIRPSVRYRGVYVMRLCNYKGEMREALLRFRSRMRENIFWEEELTPTEKAAWGITPVLGRPAPLNTLYHYIKAWPEKGMEEALSLDDRGRRLRPVSIRGPGQVCFSSALARKKFAEQMKGYVARDRAEFPQYPPEFYNLSINDTDRGNCVCPACRALAEKYGSPSGAMLEFVNSVADEVAQVYPDVRIQTSAYYFTSKAPRGIRPRENVFVRLSPIDVTFRGACHNMKSADDPVNASALADLLAWSRIGAVQLWTYWINYGTDVCNGGIVNIDAIWKNVRLYKAHGSDYIFGECEGPHLASFHGLRVFAGYQTMKDCTLDLETILDKYFENIYGPAAGPMRRLYEHIRTRQQEHPHLSVTSAVQLNYLDRAFFRESERHLAAAEKLAGNDRALLLRIAAERFVLDLTRFSVRDAWPGEPGLPSRKEILRRIEKNFTPVLRRCFGPLTARYARPLEKTIRQLSDPVPGAKYPLPEELKGRRVYEITTLDYPDMNELRKYGARLEKDPDSPTGSAVTLRKTGKDHPHTAEFSCGVQSRFLKKSLLKRKFLRTRDEKYHWHHLGRIRITPMTIFWGHGSWALQFPLDRFWSRGAENEYDLYLSIKFQGPASSPGSTRGNAVFIDRLVLAVPGPLEK